MQVLGEVPAELALTRESDDSLQSQAARVGEAVLVRLLELLGEAMEGVRAGADPRTTLELSLVKACKPELDSSTRALLARIERLERERAGPGSPAQRAPAATEQPGRGAPAGSGQEVPPGAAGPPSPEQGHAGASAAPPSPGRAGSAADGTEPPAAAEA